MFCCHVGGGYVGEGEGEGDGEAPLGGLVGGEKGRVTSFVRRDRSHLSPSPLMFLSIIAKAARGREFLALGLDGLDGGRGPAEDRPLAALPGGCSDYIGGGRRGDIWLGLFGLRPCVWRGGCFGGVAGGVLHVKG